MSGAGWRVALAVLDAITTEQSDRQRKTILISLLSVILALFFLLFSAVPVLACVLLSSSNAAQVPESSGTAVAGPSGISLIWPTPGYTTITSPYGYRIHPITGEFKFHAGVDIGAPGGAPILAAAGGTVTISTYSSSYGNYVEIDHGNGLRTRYAHMSLRLASAGETVTQGQEIGLVGATGDATGNHLHFEVRVNGITYDPMQYFT